ncbi:MAG TPA: hypothetical protein VND93_06075, partial [Myxococcales bacterium]|nr:hypothetical protein [Myxococcales bacterium]
DPALMEKVVDFGKKATAAEVDRANRPDPSDPTKGMTEDERKRYDELPPDQQQRYDDLHQEAARTQPAEQSVKELRRLLTSLNQGEFQKLLQVEDAVKDDPRAKADLHKLLFEGKLEQRSGDVSKTTLSYLDDLATQGGKTVPLEVDRKGLLTQLLRDMADPMSMVQGAGNNDCAGSGAAFLMAATHPAEYARIITQLAETGKANLTPSWAHNVFRAENVILTVGSIDPRRPITQALFAKSFVEAAAGNTAAEQVIAKLDGINGEQYAAMLNRGVGLNGRGWKPAYMPPEGDPNRKQAEADATTLLQGASEQKPVFALIGDHWVTVTKVEGDPPQVTYQDGSGQPQTRPLAEVLRELNTICFQNGDVPASMNDSRNGRPGGGGDPTLGNGGGNRSGQ